MVWSPYSSEQWPYHGLVPIQVSWGVVWCGDSRDVRLITGGWTDQVTNSIEYSCSLKANDSAASKEISPYFMQIQSLLRCLVKRSCHCFSPETDSPVHAQPSYLFQVHFNAPVSSKWPLSVEFLHRTLYMFQFSPAIRNRYVTRFCYSLIAVIYQDGLTASSCILQVVGTT
jgi:hypothetical protein